jgi:hypothetical protein
MTGNAGPSARQIAERYFEMWNTGNTSIAPEILSPGWIEHAYPEVTGPDGVQQAVEQTRVGPAGSEVPDRRHPRWR